MLPKIARTVILDYLLNDPGLAATFHLCQNNIVIADEDIVLADITEATFVGYAPISGIAFPAAAINGLLHGETLSTTQTWTAGAVVGPQTIYAAYMTVTIGGGAKLIFFKRFSAPITIFNPGDLIEKKFDIQSDTL